MPDKWDLTKRSKLRGVRALVKKIKFSTGMAKCADYIELIQSVVDNESTRDDEVYLRRHLDMCLKCLDRLNLEQELKKALQLKLQNKDVPSGLADSILKKISN